MMQTALVEESFHILNTSEYARTMGQPHKAKDPKLARTWITNAAGAAEEVFLFRNDQQPQRTLRLVTGWGELQQTELMATSSNWHEQQGPNLMRMAVEQRMSSLDQKSCHSWPSIAEHKAKLQERTPKKEDKKEEVASQAYDFQNLREEPKAFVVEDDDDDDDDEDMPPLSLSEALEQAGLTEVDNALRAKDAARANGDGAWKRFPELNPVHAASSKSAKAPASKVQRSSSTRSLKNDDGDSSKDTSSVAGGGVVSGKSAAKADPVVTHVSHLSLDEVLSGKKKGVALYHAREAKLKLSQEKQIVLGNHIRLVNYAQKLTPATVTSTPAAELEDLQVLDS